tara:strand:+ start:18724 stop:18846 length:123 start_codon:yes stop_codon:yes gene_type:complete
MSEVRWVELEQEERKARIARVVKKRAVFMRRAGWFVWRGR